MYRKAISKLHNIPFVRDTFWRGVQLVSRQGVIYAIFFFTARVLDQHEFGIYNYLLAFVFVLVTLSDFGISSASSRYVAEYAKNDREKMRDLPFNAMIMVGTIAGIIALGTLLFGQVYLGEVYMYVPLVLPLLFFVPLVSLYDGVLRATGRFKELTYVSTLVGLGAIPFSYMSIVWWGLKGALIAQNVLYAATALALFIIYREMNLRINVAVMKDVVRYGFILGMVSAMYFLFTKVNTLVMGHGGDFKIISNYELLVKILMLVLLPFTVFAQAIGPRLVSYASEHIFSLYGKVLRASLSIGVVLFVLANVGVGTMIPYMLPAYDTPLFITAFRLYSVIFITQGMAIVASGAFSTYLGHATLNLRLLYVLFPLNLALVIFVLPQYGFITFIGLLVFLQVAADILYVWLLRRRLYAQTI